ncbi:MAG: hypothetical protein WDO15_19875 [Bacteroidota bacterium]
MTDEKNLITLCRRCHSRLNPHEDQSLYKTIGVKPILSKKQRCILRRKNSMEFLRSAKSLT